jgi:hypothetical protein
MGLVSSFQILASSVPIPPIPRFPRFPGLKGVQVLQVLYTADTFFEIKWRWKYLGGQIDELVSFCPKCDYQIYPKRSGGFHAAPGFIYECEDCRSFAQVFDQPPEEIENKILRMIQKKLRAQMSAGENSLK